jgi:hypothetical protein
MAEHNRDFRRLSRIRHRGAFEGLDHSPVRELTRVTTLFSTLALEARIDGFTFKCEDTKNTFVDTAKRFIPNESFQRFNPKSEFAKC